MEERVEVTSAIEQPEGCFEVLPSWPIFLGEGAGGVRTPLHKVEVPPHDSKFGGKGSDGQVELFDHTLLNSNFVLIRGEQAEINKFKRKVGTQLRDEQNQAVTHEAGGQLQAGDSVTS